MIGSIVHQVSLSTSPARRPIILLCAFLFFPFSSLTAQTNAPAGKDVLNYSGNPLSATSRKLLAFSDKGAWFAYGFPDKVTGQAGFTGPFLMTEQHGVWLSNDLTALTLTDKKTKKNLLNETGTSFSHHSYLSHLEQTFRNNSITVKQQLVFLSGNTALQRTQITNNANRTLILYPEYKARLFLSDMKLSVENHFLRMTSSKSPAVGYLGFLNQRPIFTHQKNGYRATLRKLVLKPGQTTDIIISQTFIFPEYSWKKEKQKIEQADFRKVLDKTIQQKQKEWTRLIKQKSPVFSDTIYSQLLAKLLLTLQNNTREAAGALKHAGLFPSYHYKWFLGFWAWDSWKHAAAVAEYNPALSEDQVRAMFDYQKANGFIPDCIFRDTITDPDNFRNTKPPLATWAVWKIFEENRDTAFLSEMYPKLKLYHQWWYKNRDHDHDSLCEYGSTDGTLTAAKWESGMDNAVRFDSAKMVKNGNNAYSLNQESVDLNAYLYAEKEDLGRIAEVLGKPDEARQWNQQAIRLKKKIQQQFWDENSGWFYDTNLSGKKLLSRHKGCEGYIPLWAGAATQHQAKTMLKNIMDTTVFNTFVPLPTLAANDIHFEPEKGYWRGPVWIDQSYFALTGLKKYGYTKQADFLAKKLMKHASGILQKGISIRENYQPDTGKGLNAKNFSWSAAHLLLLLTQN